MKKTEVNNNSVLITNEDIELLISYIKKVCNEGLHISLNTLQGETLTGFNRASRLMTYLEEQGIVTPKENNNPRIMKVSLEEALEILNKK